MDLYDPSSTRTALQVLTDTLPYPAWLLAADFSLEYANEAFRAFTGLDVAQARSREARYALAHPDDLGSWHAGMQHADATGQGFEVDLRLRRADGVFRLMHLRYVPTARDEAGATRWVATATDIEDDRQRETLLKGMTETAVQLIWIARPDGVDEYWNARLRDYTGFAPDPETGFDWTRIFHPADAAYAMAEYADALREERRYEVQFRLRRHDGVYRWFLARAEPARDENGAVVRWIGTATDIEDHKRSEDATSLLLDATGIIAGRREIDSVLPAVTERVVRDFAGSCSLYRRDRQGEIALVVVSSRDAERGALTRDMLRMYPVRETDPIGEVMQFNEHVLVPHIDQALLERIAQDERHLGFLRTIGATSALIVPLSARGEALGALQFARFDGEPPFDERDVATAQILANRVAGAIDEAVTRESERRLAETFQASALPRRLPDLPGIEVRAIYQAAAVGINVGGDWYDAFELSPWRLVVSIGDVAGKGVDAAATMSLIRHGIRFAAHRGQDPADILGVVDNALRAESPDLTATAFVAIVDIRESRVRYASAGHPPAALRLPNGKVRLLDPDPAPPLGSWPEGMRPQVDVSPLVYGSLLVLYTDGLTEVDRDPIDGERQLVGLLRDESVFASTNPARYVRDAIVGERAVRDDVAVITLAYGRRRGWSFEAPDAMRAQPARASFERWLSREAEGDVYGAALVFGELVGNVVRHAPGPIEMRAEWRGEQLTLHVFDRGPGFAGAGALPDASSESGRGLFIIHELAQDIIVAPTASGSRVTVTLPVTRRAATHQ